MNGVFAPHRLRHLGLLALLLACQCKDPSQATVSATETEQEQAPEAPHPWHALEQQRDLEGVLRALGEPLSAADRAAGARALARMGGQRAADRLREMLADEDLDVVRWAAFGIAQDCTGQLEPLVNQLLSRSASIQALAAPSAEREAAQRALAMALGRCGSADSEKALRSWLAQGQPLAEHAQWGLGQLAAHHGRLSDESQVALLDSIVDERSTAGLFAFTRLTRLSEAVQVRLLEVSGQALTNPAGWGRSLAVRALPQAGPAAAEPLAQVLKNTAFSSEERAMAAQALRQLGSRGQQALAKAVSDMPLPTFTSLAGLGGNASAQQGDALAAARPSLESALVWSATLTAFEQPQLAKKRLQQLAELELPAAENPLGRRRTIAIRCRAAELLAGTNPAAPSLSDCDPDQSEIGAQALVRTLDRTSLEGQHLTTWRTLVDDPRAAVRQSALRLLAGHSEVTDSAQVLQKALASDQLGTVVTALQLLAAYPARGARNDKGKQADFDSQLVEAIERVLQREDWRHAIEAKASALDAIAGLGVLSLKGLVEAHCKSPHFELRQHAQRALGLLGDPKRRCTDMPLWNQEATAPGKPVRLELHSDLGLLRLHLDGAAAPAAVQRITELARSEYYDGLAVHRVVEGFVVQFGDAPGDGFGDPRHAPLPCERSPTAFNALDVGMAIAGRDTASTQWFVTLARYPQLDGAYTRIGRAEGPWNLLVAGDRIRAVRVAEK